MPIKLWLEAVFIQSRQGRLHFGPRLIRTCRVQHSDIVYTHLTNLKGKAISQSEYLLNGFISNTEQKYRLLPSFSSAKPWNGKSARIPTFSSAHCHN